jgi:hypothetical protein
MALDDQEWTYSAPILDDWSSAKADRRNLPIDLSVSLLLMSAS